MKEHYGLTEEQYQSLLKGGITTLDMIQCLQYFGPKPEHNEINSWSLLHYVDRFGDLDSKSPHGLLARAIYSNLSDSGKIEILTYIEDSKTGEEDGD